MLTTSCRYGALPAIRSDATPLPPLPDHTYACHALWQSEFTDEYARLKRAEWRDTLREYARPFYTARMLSGTVSVDVDYDAWFVSWLGSIEHLVPRLR